MILFVNVFITDKKHSNYNPYDRGLYPEVNPYEVFKYSLASLSVIKWSKVIIYCLLDDDYEHNREDLAKTVKELFGDCSLYFHRNVLQKQWQKAIEEIDDELVWFTGNHDHVFIDYETSVLDAIVSEMMKRDEKYMSCYFSHWPELLAGLSHWGFIEKDRNFFTYRRPDSDSIQIVTKELLKEWWWGEDYGDRQIPRTDHCVKQVPTLMFIPMRELCRHFDGYKRQICHVDINKCPPLFIPEGFWENDINIAYGDKIENYVNINPCNPNYSCVSIDGADLRGVVEDIPLFWRKRIKNIVANNVTDDFVKCRNDNVYELSKSVGEVVNREELTVAFR